MKRFTFSVSRFTFCALTLLPTPAAAHDRSTSYSTWDIRGRQAQVTVRLAELEVTHLPWVAAAGAELDRMLGAYLGQHLLLLAGDGPCPVTDGPRALRAAPGRMVYEWRVLCPDTGALAIRSDVLLDVVPSHLHFVRVGRDGARGLERVLSDRERAWPLAGSTAEDNETPGTSLAGYIRLGVEHILSGYDHLAFLLALLLIGGAVGEIAKVVTGFTVAHSITLALSVLGYLRPAAAPVEALIGLSIALVAAENVWLIGRRRLTLPCLIAGALALMAWAAITGHGRVPALTLAGLALFSICYFGLLRRVSRAASLRWAIAFLFGLVHGFGFAAVLGEAGLPPDRVAHALLGFNLGVELGQLAVVAALWPALRLAGRRALIRHAIVDVGSAAVLALGVFWFVSRTYR